MTTPDDGLRRIRQHRPPSARVRRLRFDRYSEWFSDDIAEFLAFWIPVTSQRGRSMIARMRNRVIDREVELPDLNRQEIVDLVTNETLEAIDAGEEQDPILSTMQSP